MSRTDFNGDGRSDILWLQGGDITVSNWLATPAGGYVINDSNALTPLNVMHQFQFVASGDFNGDGRSDLLWKVDGDGYSVWFTNPQGGFSVTGPSMFFDVADEQWSVAGAGDFNGDGTDDLLWRHANGTIGTWLGQTSGNFAITSYLVHVPNEWQVIGTGDFNGDHRSDLLWQSANGMISNWLGTQGGGFVINDANALTAFDGEILGIGDFDGDGLDDLLHRSFGDEVYMLQTYADGAFYPGWGNGFVKRVSLDWDVAAIGDYHGDGTDDILWRNDNGLLGNWLGTAGNGYEFTVNDAASLTMVPNDWQVADPWL